MRVLPIALGSGGGEPEITSATSDARSRFAHLHGKHPETKTTKKHPTKSIVLHIFGLLWAGYLS